MIDKTISTLLKENPTHGRFLHSLGVDFEAHYPPGWFHDPNKESPKMELASVPLHETWAAMESLVAEGLVKHIGVCNYNSALIHDLMAYANIKPAMLQVELHPS